MSDRLPEVSVVVTGLPPRAGGEPSQIVDWLRVEGVSADTGAVEAPDRLSLAGRLQRTSGAWVMTVGGRLASRREAFLSAFRALYAARTRGDVLIGVPAGAPPAGGASARQLRSLLALPTAALFEPVRLYARDVIRELVPTLDGGGGFLETLVQAQNLGWQIREVPLDAAEGAGDRDACPPVTRLDQLRLWQMRNNAMGADYDERAFDSRIFLQRYWQRTRHEIILEFSGKRGSILDIGCGSSRIIQEIPNAIGLDILLKKLRYLRRKGHPLVQGSAWGLPFRDGAFDEVICSEVIEHIPMWPHLFREFARVMRPGGRLIVGTPDYSRHVWVALEIAYGLVLPHAYAHEHISHYTHASMRAHLKAAGFAVRRARYVGGGELIFLARKGISSRGFG